MLRVLAVSAVLSAMLATGVAAGAPSRTPLDPVPRDHWAYETIKRFDCDWCTTAAYFDTRPMRTMLRYEFALATAQICTKIAGSEEARRAVTSLQLSGLMRLIDEFCHGLTDAGIDADALKRGLPSVLSAERPELDLRDYPELAATPRDHWAYEPIRRLYELGVFEGCSRPCK